MLFIYFIDFLLLDEITSSLDVEHIQKVKQVLKRMIRTGVKEIPVLNKDKRIIADLTLADLLRFVVNSNEH